MDGEVGRLVFEDQPDMSRIVEVAAEHGTLRNPVTIWVVPYGNDLYVRSAYGRTAAWFRGIQVRHEGRIWAGGVEKDVTFVDGLAEGLITLSKHACFGGAVSFHEHRSETCDVTMRFAAYAPPRRVLDPGVAQEEQG